MGIGPGELLLILLIALIVFGPGRLPELARALGKSVREFREAARDVTAQIAREIREAEKGLKPENREGEERGKKQ